MKTLCVVPARSGSKGVPGKNTRLVGGKPLLGHAIEAITESGVFDQVVLSTDSASIADLVRDRYPAVDVPFLRDEATASDEAPLIAVSKHAMEFFDGQGARFDAVFSVQVTNPMIRAETLRKASETLRAGGCDSVVSVTEILHFHPFRSYALSDKSGLLSPLTEYSTEALLQKQDRPAAYGFTGSIYGRRRHLLEAWSGTGFALGERPAGIVVCQEEALDIDTQLDMEIIESLFHWRSRTGARSTWSGEQLHEDR